MTREAAVCTFWLEDLSPAALRACQREITPALRYEIYRFIPRLKPLYYVKTDSLGLVDVWGGLLQIAAQ